MLSLENVKVTPGRHFWFVFVSVQELPGNWLSCEMQEGYFELGLEFVWKGIHFGKGHAQEHHFL